MGEKTVKEVMEAETALVENGIEYYEENGLYYPKLILGDEMESDVYVGRWLSLIHICFMGMFLGLICLLMDRQQFLEDLHFYSEMQEC